MLEAAAEKLQAALLASLEDEKPEGAQQQAKAKRKKEKKGRRLKKPAAQCELVKHATSQAESSTLHCDSTSPERSPARPGNDTCQQQGRSNGTAPERDVLASGVADAGQSTEGPPETAADTDGGQTHSSGGEGEHSRNPALGLAGETTSEDEWKVCSHWHDHSYIVQPVRVEWFVWALHARNDFTFHATWNYSQPSDGPGNSSAARRLLGSQRVRWHQNRPQASAVQRQPDRSSLSAANSTARRPANAVRRWLP